MIIPAQITPVRTGGHHYSFAIVCTARSGSHFFASLLDSHPEIEMDGELFNNRDFLHKAIPDESKTRGAILMQKYIPRANLVQADRYVCLMRDASETARSALVAKAIRARDGRDYRSHRLAGEPPLPEVEIKKPELESATAIVLAQQVGILRFLTMSRKPWMMVHYRHLAADPNGPWRPLLFSFLGVGEAQLKTSLVRGGA